MNVYKRPFRTGAVPIEATDAAQGIRVRGIEVIQAVQNLAHDVTLIADKATLVRVYLDPASVASKGTVRGEVVWSRGGGEGYLASLNAIELDPAAPATTIRDQRSQLTASLNFRLPVDAIGAGTTKISLNRVSVPGGAPITLVAPEPRTVRFVRAGVLRVRAVGLRYKKPGAAKPVAPDAVHFAYLRSFLQRTYPTAKLEWSQIVVDANFASPFDKNTSLLANAQLAAMRSLEVSSGVDPRTHYYGIVDDNGGADFMRGSAYAIPASPQPDVVASGPAGVPNGFSGDHDASYADWYGAHELGHTFGRYHPGFPPGDQDASDTKFPYPKGQISQDDGRFVGLDIGDPEIGIQMRILTGETHHDIMTYGTQQWISEHTFEAIHERLVAEDALGDADGNAAGREDA
jgi:hypothetical protein